MTKSQESQASPPSITHLLGAEYARLPLCISPGSHYFQLDHIKRDTAVCTRCGLIRKAQA